MLYKIVIPSLHYRFSSEEEEERPVQSQRRNLTSVALPASNDQVQTCDHARSEEKSNPKNHIPQYIPVLHEPGPAERRERNLQQLAREQISPHLLEQAEHKQLVYARAEQEGDERGTELAELEGGDGGMVYMT